MSANIWIPVLILGCYFSIAASENDTRIEVTLKPEEARVIEKRVSDQILQILEHYKQEDPIGLPGAPVPDPMEIPDMKQSFSVATMNFKNTNVYGLSKFRIEHIRSNLADMKVSVGMRIDTMLIKGKYTMSTWLSRQAGDFNVTLTNVTVQGIASLEVNRGGQLEAQDIDMDITFQSIAMNFQNLGFMGTIFQGIINSVGTFLFDSVKPFILSQVNTNVRGDVNKHIMEIPQRFPNSIPPLDMAIAEARKYVRDEGYDPYKIPDYNHTAGIFTIYLRHIWLTGLASFHRVGNVSVIMEKNVVHVGMNVGTQRLKGSCQWEVGVAGLVSRAGTTSFTAEYIQGEFTVAQPLDVRKRPILEDLNLRLGNIQMRVDGAGTADYIMEFVVNIIPNLLRYQIVDAIEGPLKQRIQAVLDQIDVEKLIEENLPQLDGLVGAKDSD